MSLLVVYEMYVHICVEHICVSVFSYLSGSRRRTLRRLGHLAVNMYLIQVTVIIVDVN